jgi:hypothetical protein
MKRIFRVFLFFPLWLILFSAPVFGDGGAELPRIVEDVIRNRDFFGSPWALWDYENCVLLDALRLDEKRIGVDLITPSGLEYIAVYDVKTFKVIYSDVLVPEKSAREAMRHGGISVSDAMKVAKSAVDAEARLKERDLPFEVPAKTPEGGTKKGNSAIRKMPKATK